MDPVAMVVPWRGKTEKRGSTDSERQHIVGRSMLRTDLWVEIKTHDLRCMATEGMVQLPCFRIPQLAGFVERACDYLVPIGIVESNRIYDIFVAFQCEKLLAGLRVPHLTSAIVAPSDKFITRFVESAIRERQNVGTQDLEKVEVVNVVHFQFLDELKDKFAEVPFPVFGNEWLFENNLFRGRKRRGQQ